MTWHTIEAHFTIGTPILHADVGPALPDAASARAAIQVRLDQIRQDHLEDSEAHQAADLWAAGQDEVYAGTYTWAIIEAVLSVHVATHTYLTGLARSFTEAVGLDLTIAEPNFTANPA